MRNIKFEFKRAFSSLGFKISLVMGLVIASADLFFFYMQYGAPGGKSLNQAWIGLDFQFAYNQLFYVLLPVIACLPYAGTYFQDMHTGYDKNICIRSSRKKYIFAKSMAVFSVSFVAVIIPLLLNLFITAGLYPNLLPEKLTWLSAGIMDVNRLSYIFNTNPVCYCIIYIFIDGIIGGLLGMVSLTVSRLCKTMFAVIMFPFVMYITTSMIFQFDDGSCLSLMEIANPVQNYKAGTWSVVLLLSGLFLISALIIWLISRKRDIL